MHISEGNDPSDHCRIQKVHLSIGDKILVDKEDAIIQKIESNPAYFGAAFAEASPTLDYWGYDPKAASRKKELDDDDMDFILSQAAKATKESEDRVNQASHIITYRKVGADFDERVQSAGDINAILLGYVLTVHKAQGSEWEKVIQSCMHPCQHEFSGTSLYCNHTSQEGTPHSL